MGFAWNFLHLCVSEHLVHVHFTSISYPIQPTQYNIPAQSFASHELASSHMPPHSFHSGQWQMPARAGPSCQPSSWNNGLR